MRRRGFTLVELLTVIALILVLVALLLPAVRRSVEAAKQVTCLNHLRQIGQAAMLYCQDNDGAFPGVTGVDPGSTSGPAPLPWEWVYWETSYSAPFNDVKRSPILRYLSGADPGVLRCPSDEVASHPSPNPHHPEFGPYNFSYVLNGWTATWPQDWSVPAWKQQYGIWPAFRIHEVKDAGQKILALEEDPRFVDDGSYFVKIFLLQGPFAEPPSFVHDVYRNMADPTQSSDGWSSRANAVFCDGHGEFVTGLFIAPGVLHPGQNLPADRAHFDPHL